MKNLFTFFCIFLSLFGYSQTTPFSFTSIPTGTEVISPARGAEHWNRLSPGPFSLGNNQITVPDGNTEVPDAYARFSWWEMETSQGVYNWTKFDQFFQACIAKRKKASFGIMTQLSGEGISTGGAVHTYPTYVHTGMQAAGTAANRDFVYAGAWVPNYNSEAYLSAFENLNDAIADHIANTSYAGVAYKDIVGYVDIRGIGEFGEWHHYPYIDVIYGSARYPTIATFKRIIDSHKNSFPNYPLLSLISGFDPGASANTPAEITHYLLTQKNTWGFYGWRWDSWGQGIYSSILENNPGTFGGFRFDTAIANRSRLAPVGGEPSSWEDGVSDFGNQSLYYLLPSQVTLYGAAFFGNGNYDAGTINASPAASANIRNASKNAGYRIILASGSITTSLQANAPFNITLGWRNIGVAPVYEKWDVTYELRSGATVVWKDTSDFQLRHFLPSGTATSYSESFTIPGSVASGTYNLHLVIRDSTQYRVPFPLAINGRQADGSYILRSGISFSNSGNTLPTVNAGSNISIQLPANTTTLTGTASDPDGTISSYLWTKVSGPAGGIITSPSAASTGLSALIAGTYVYRLTVTDNGGATNFDDVQVMVLAANTPPVANAGVDKGITLPVTNTTVTGSGTDADGTIASYAWTKISGPTGGVITSPSNATTAITVVSQGTYVFRLTVTDNNGATSFDEMTLTVLPATNQAPVANAGANQAITLPTNSVTFVGSGTDADGTITSYLWTKVSGPTGGNITSPSSSSTSITAMTSGTYLYRLTVTDNSGATNSDDVQVVVSSTPPANQPPIANAGANITIVSPVDSVLLTGSATDADGTIVSYIWSKVSGTGGLIASANTASTKVYNLTAGTYTFRLAVVDNNGASAVDDVIVTVNQPVNIAPTANAGANQTITLPISTTTLTGSGTDTDGSIVSYLWTKFNGPAGGSIASPNSATTTISGLIEGTYVYRLTVTDNSGATGVDNMQIIVDPAPVVVTGNWIFTTNPNPVTSSDGGTGVTLGVKFRTSVAGGITRIRFWKVTGNTGTHTAAIWDASGSILASGTFTGETSSGWQYLTLSDTLLVDAGVTYVVAYFCPEVVYGSTEGGFNGNVTNGTLTAPQSSTVGGNGVYNYGASLTFPTDTYMATNYWVDVEYVTVAPPPVIPNTPPSVAAGFDQTIRLPVSSVTVTATATDTDGTISTIDWSQISGPVTAVIADTAALSTGISGLSQQGVYQFLITVTDDDGATASDIIAIAVNGLLTSWETKKTYMFNGRMIRFRRQ